MYFKWLRSFHSVAHEGGFTAASRVLNIGQSTITAQVKALEERFGIELFYRKGRRVILTDFGRTLFNVTQDIFGHYNEAVQVLNTAKAFKSGHLRIGAVGPPVGMELAEVFQRRNPEVQLSITVGQGAWAVQNLIDFQTDVAVLAHVERDRRFCSLPYKRYEVVAFVRADHPWVRRKSIDIHELAGERMVLREKTSTTRMTVERAIRKARVRPRSVLEINSREAVREAVLRGFGVGMVSEIEYVPDEGLHPLHVTGAQLAIKFNVSCLADRRNRPLIAAFFDVAEEVVGTSNRLQHDKRQSPVRT